MENIDFKKLLIEHCTDIIRKKALNVENEMTETQQQVNDYGAPKDRYDAFRTKMMRQKDMLGQQLEILLNDIMVLQTIDTKKVKNAVEQGTVVITEKQKMFISVGLGKVDLEGKTFFVISTKVPFYVAIKGLKNGDTFDFRGVKDKIIEVF
jgi:hypothetical protein